MTNKQVLFQRIVSADGKIVAEACSEASAFGNGSTISQSVTVKTASGHSSSSSLSSSTSSSQ